MQPGVGATPCALASPSPVRAESCVVNWMHDKGRGPFMKRLLYALIAVAGLALIVVSGQAEAGAQSTDNPADVAAGEAIYATSCAGCHAADGSGVAGRGRPLTGIAAQGDRDAHIDAIANGKGSMPAFGEKLSSDEVGQVASYVRLSFVEKSAETELAVTGVSSALLTVLGLAMLIGGWLMVVWSKAESERTTQSLA